MTISTSWLVTAAAGVVGTVISVLWNLWLTAERRAAKNAHDGLSSRVDHLEAEIEKLELGINKRLDRIEDKLDAVLAGRK